MVVWYDNLPGGEKSKSTVTSEEVMANLPHLVLLARHVRMRIGVRSLLKNAHVAWSPAHRDAMRQSARELHALHTTQSFRADDILKSKGAANTTPRRGTGKLPQASLDRPRSSTGRLRPADRPRKRRPSFDDSSVRLRLERMRK